jgi:hypothetical protein
MRTSDDRRCQLSSTQFPEAALNRYRIDRPRLTCTERHLTVVDREDTVVTDRVTGQLARFRSQHSDFAAGYA